MANILCAQENPLFGWYYKWRHLNEDGVPDMNIKSALKKPEKAQVTFDIPCTGANARGRVRDVTVDIVPDKGQFGA